MLNVFDRAVAVSSIHIRYIIGLLLLTLAVFLASLLYTNARADYPPLALSDLFGKSDLIVLGIIESVDDNDFTIRETEIFSGGVENVPIVVKKYSNWFGGHRWSTYRKGQTVLLFLEKSPQEDSITNATWQIRGLGGEGEMPIEDGAVFVHTVNLKGFQRKKHNLNNGELYSYRFDMHEFKSALKGYLRCYGSPLTAATNGMNSPTSTSECSESERASYRTTSRLHCHLAKANTDKDE